MDRNSSAKTAPAAANRKAHKGFFRRSPSPPWLKITIVATAKIITLKPPMKTKCSMVFL